METYFQVESARIVVSAGNNDAVTVSGCPVLAEKDLSSIS